METEDQMSSSPDDIERFSIELETQGFVIIENAIEPAFLQELSDTVTRLEKRAQEHGYPPTVGYEGYYDTVRVKNLLSCDPIFRKVATYPVVMQLVARFLGEGAQLNAMATLSLNPGDREQVLHCDDYNASLPRPHQPLILNAIWALSDFTPENGATRLAPGSHLWPELAAPSATEALRSPNPYPCEQVSMKASSIMIFNGSIWHGGSANHSDERRVAMAVQYCRKWMRPFEDFKLSISPKLVKDFSPQLRELCGYGKYHVGVDGKPPIVALEECGWRYPSDVKDWAL